MRILYSFPNKIGAARICYTAWEQVRGLAAAGADVTVFPGAVARPLPANVAVRPTLARGKLRLPYKLLGRMGACVLHDRIVARRLEKMAGKVDLVHCWPLGSLETLKTAKRMGIPAVLERPNAHTRFCYETVAAECRRLGLSNPHHEYQEDYAVLLREEAEFEEAFGLLCPGAFPSKTFEDRGFAKEKLFRHSYGFDENKYFPDATRNARQGQLIVLFVGVDAIRKGLHLALEAWLASPASRNGKFLIAGELSAEFKGRWAMELAHPSVKALGHRSDVPELMRNADMLLMPSFEEGSALVCMDAIGSGCVPVVSAACSDACQHMHNALVHAIGDTQTLQRHITLLYEDRSLLGSLRDACIRERLRYTWPEAGKKLFAAYRLAVDQYTATRQAAPNQIPLNPIQETAAQPGVPAASQATSL